MSTNTKAIKVDPPRVLPFGDGDYTGSERPETPPGIIRGFGQNINFWEVKGITRRAQYKTPSGGPAKEVQKRIVYINGMNSSRENHANSAKLLSIVSGATVVGIYNQSGNGLNGGQDIGADVLESIYLYTGKSDNPPTATLIKAIIDACTGGIQLNTVSTSQGSIVVSVALTIAKTKLIKRYTELDGEGKAEIARRQAFISGDARFRVQQIQETQNRRNAGNTLPEIIKRKILPLVEKRLEQFVSVHTFGGAIKTYPTGPRYRHVINAWDPIPTGGGFNISPALGVSSTDNFTQTINRNAGDEGKDPAADHDFDNLYIQSSQYFVDRTGRKVDNQYIPLDMSIIR